MSLRILVSGPSVLTAAVLVAACSGGEPSAPDEPLGQAESALGRERARGREAAEGRRFFEHALHGTNGRSCATCHVPGNAFTLTPADVEERFAKDPHEPLFNRLDADDPTAAHPTFRHVKAGLIRVTLSLADNVDVISDCGQVITSADRTLSVWRAVPSVQNVTYTAPYQFDGRFATLQDQANGALHAHSQIDHAPTKDQLDDIAAFERTVFSDVRAFAIAAMIEGGLTPPNLEPDFPSGSDGDKGKQVFYRACSPCHAGATQIEMPQSLRDQLHPVLKSDGSVDVVTGPGGVTVAASTYHNLTDHPMVNLGISFGTYLAQVGAVPNPTGLDFPHYRLRFYTDATRTTKLVDLPPPPPAIGPTLSPQAFSVDPGRAVTSGDPRDWEAFDVPQLRGIRHTGPYFHDNSARDMPAVLDVYSRFILGAIPQLGLPSTLPPEGPNLPPEALSPEQKKQLLAFLDKL